MIKINYLGENYGEERLNSSIRPSGSKHIFRHPKIKERLFVPPVRWCGQMVDLVLIS